MKRLEEINRPDLGGKSFIIEFEREVSDHTFALISSPTPPQL